MVAASILDDHELASRTAPCVQTRHFVQELHFALLAHFGARRSVLLACLVGVPGHIAVRAEPGAAALTLDVGEARRVAGFKDAVAVAAVRGTDPECCAAGVNVRVEELLVERVVQV
jgi:hypothetical protein